MSEYFIKPIVKILMLKSQEGQSIKGIGSITEEDIPDALKDEVKKLMNE